MLPFKKIFVAGHNGMVGSAIVRALKVNSDSEILTRTRSELDLGSQQAVKEFLDQSKPDYVIVAAAKVGGVHANDTYPADFIYENLMIECNLIRGAYLAGCTNLLFLGSSCIYPRMAPQPMKEESLLDGHLEPTNEPYALAKIAGIKLCESHNRQHGTDYRSLMPTNLYGPGDNFHLENSHVIPALIRRIHEAKINNVSEVSIWGTGEPKREFLHVDDLAAACVFMMGLHKSQLEKAIEPMMSHINVGTGEDVKIRELAKSICKVVDFKGNLAFDTSKPDGAPRKLLDVSKINQLGWKADTSLDEGLAKSYRWFLENQPALRK